MKKAFTLIELLIVVAIIAILAAIAVPNFLEAQTRSKVSRVKAELRTLATAIESYRVDNNKPPPQAATGGVGPFAPIQPGSGTGVLTHAITTPIAYMTSFMFYDPFSVAGTAIDEKLYSYHPVQWVWREDPPAMTAVTVTAPTSQPNLGVGECNELQFREMYGDWRLLSIGPDKTYYNRDIGSGFSSARIRLPYDPTNGTVHYANIMRSQKEPEQRTFIIDGSSNTGL